MKTIEHVKRKAGLFLFAGGIGALFVAASTSVSGNNRITGRVVLDRPGTYTVGQNIDLLADANAGAPVIKITSGGVIVDLDGYKITGPSGAPVIEIAPLTNVDQPVTIRDGMVQGGSVGSSATGTTARYENMVFAESITHGIDASDSNVAIVGSRIRMAGGSAVHLSMGQPVQDWLISDSTINGTGGNAIDAHGLAALRVERTTIRNAGVCGLMIANDSTTGQIGSGLTAIDTRVSHAGRDGIHVIGRAPVTVAGGRLSDIYRNGVYVNGSDQPVSVTDAAAQDVGALGIKVVGGGTTEITGNRLRRFGSTDPTHSAGIEIDGNGGPATTTISGNTIVGGVDAHVGVQLAAGTTARVSDNLIAGVDIGVSVLATDTLIEECRIERARVAGIFTSAKGSIIRRNRVRAFVGVGDSLTAGVWAGAGAQAGLVEDNVISGFPAGYSGPGLQEGPNFIRGNLFACNTVAFTGGTDAGGNIMGTCTE